MSESAQPVMPETDDGGGDELRAAPRFTLLLRTAKLIGAAGEYLCVVRDVSSTGISVRTFHPLSESRLVLELPNGDRHPLDKVWENDGAAGFRFAGEEVDVTRLIEGKGRFPKRGVRLHMELPATLSSLGGLHDAVVRNLSQQGARVETRSRFALDQRVQLELKGLPAIRAVVRWRKDQEYGLAFVDTFQFAELARLAATLQSGCRTEFTTGEQMRNEVA
ncbi:MAG TPA: PilZ domain-containing protein [Croceibacterium sp.]|nr:PilZ domain-containing protein [Croceibacterium sp.]